MSGKNDCMNLSYRKSALLVFKQCFTIQYTVVVGLDKFCFFAYFLSFFSKKCAYFSFHYFYLCLFSIFFYFVLLSRSYAKLLNVILAANIIYSLIHHCTPKKEATAIPCTRVNGIAITIPSLHVLRVVLLLVRKG